ncbi:MAG: helix-turn-helix transcriptional regulator [Negativicutes bacterium]|nr:helix-turn-helix transcriptional regulator [Negativicutes bacterium]
MSEFSDYFKAILTSKKINIYNLALQADVDRSTIHKVASGSRIPNRAFLEKLLRYLPVTPIEKKLLLEKHQICCDGPDIYERRKKVKAIISDLMQLSLSHNTVSFSFHHSEDRLQILRGTQSIRLAIKEMVEREAYTHSNPKILMKVPPCELIDIPVIATTCADGPEKVDWLHIVGFDSENSLINQNENLELLKSILPYCFLDNLHYQPYYFYETKEHKEDEMQTLPFFIITSEYLLQLNYDFKSALLTKNSKIIEYYTDEFFRIQKNTLPLSTRKDNAISIVQYFIDILQSSNGSICFYEHSPNFSCVMDEAFVRRRIREDMINRDQVVENVAVRFNLIRNRREKFHTYFTLDGLNKFCQTGVVVNTIPKYDLPYSIEDRLYLLNHFIEEAEKRTICARLLTPSMSDISESISITSFGRDGLNIAAYNLPDEEMRASYITEANLTAAFQDYLLWLEGTDLILSEEESIKILRTSRDNLTMRKQ